MPEYVLAKDKETGHHIPVLRSHYDRNPGLWQELKGAATYADGTPVRVKHKTSVESSAAKKTGGQTADTEKE